jgi:hypothetical protein
MKPILFCTALFLISCSAKVVPLRNQYPVPPMTFKTENKIDQVWSNLIDFIATTGMSIKIIDRGSGLLITEDYSFVKKMTHENQKTKKVNNPDAYLVSNWYKISGGYLAPTEVMANWNIRLKEIEGGGTNIAVNITNVRAVNAIDKARVFDVRSTGVFEKMIFDIVK